MDPKNRVCVVCKHWYLDCGSPYYSEATPGYGAEMWCEVKREKYEYKLEDISQAKFAEIIKKARKCKHFAMREE